MEYKGKQTEGFMTNKNRFVIRIAAGVIAFDAEQTLEYKEQLFSEDIY